MHLRGEGRGICPLRLAHAPSRSLRRKLYIICQSPSTVLHSPPNILKVSNLPLQGVFSGFSPDLDLYIRRVDVVHLKLFLLTPMSLMWFFMRQNSVTRLTHLFTILSDKISEVCYKWYSGQFQYIAKQSPLW